MIGEGAHNITVDSKSDGTVALEAAAHEILRAMAMPAPQLATAVSTAVAQELPPPTGAPADGVKRSTTGVELLQNLGQSQLGQITTFTS